MTRLRTAVAIVALLVCSPMAARADVVPRLEPDRGDDIDRSGQSPFAQADTCRSPSSRVEAVNAITTVRTVPGTVCRAGGRIGRAAAIAAAHRVLKNYFPGNAALDPATRQRSLAIPNGSAKTDALRRASGGRANDCARVGTARRRPEFYCPSRPTRRLADHAELPCGRGVNFQCGGLRPSGPEYPAARAGSIRFSRSAAGAHQ